MTDRTVQLAAAVWSALSGDATLATQLGGSGRVFTGVTANQPAPYVDIADFQGVDYGTSSGDAQEHTFMVHVFVEQPAGATSAALACMNAVARIRAVLHANTLAMGAGRMANLRCEMTQPALRDPDGISWHGVLRFRAVTEN